MSAYCKRFVVLALAAAVLISASFAGSVQYADAAKEGASSKATEASGQDAAGKAAVTDGASVNSESADESGLQAEKEGENAPTEQEAANEERSVAKEEPANKEGSGNSAPVQVTVYRVVDIEAIENRKGNALLQWKADASAQGYRIYRCPVVKGDGHGGESVWSSASYDVITSNTVTFTQDKNVAEGAEYRYVVLSYRSENLTQEEIQKLGQTQSVKLNDLLADSRSRTSVYLGQTQITKFQRQSGNTSLKLGWKPVRGANGYQIQYCTNSCFQGAKTCEVSGGSTVARTISGLGAKNKYYVLIRARADAKTAAGSNQRFYSMWALSPNVTASHSSRVSYLKKGKSKLNIVKLAKQTKTGYTIAQGSATDGTYAYFVLWRSANNKGKIVKVRLKDRKLIKVSKPLSIHHGNGMTYDQDRKQLAVIHGQLGNRTVTFINPNSLTIASNRTVSLPDRLFGMTERNRKEFKGFSMISYNSALKQYVLKVMGTMCFLVTDCNLKPIRYMTGTQPISNVSQSMTSTRDVILRTHSGPNIIACFDWYGNLISKVKVGQSGELESLFYVGNTLYGSIYTYEIKTWYTTKTKKLKVKKKGKWVTVKRKVKVKHRKVLGRACYVVTLSEY